MMKFYALALASFFGFSAIGQRVPVTKKNYTQSELMTINPIAKDNPDPSFGVKKKLQSHMPIVAHNKSMSLWEQIIGYTTYDNQSNNSMQDRIVLDDQEVAHATWTMSFQNNTSWTDRGTGYNSGQGYVWGADPYDRLEDERAGWPGIFMTGDNAEAYVYHSGDGAPTLARRTTPGSGDWTYTQLPTALENNFIWPRSIADGNKIHVIALSEPTALDGTEINGVDGNLVYWRSDDNGATWAVQDHFFPELSPDEYKYIQSDGYALDARDGKVSVAVFCEFFDSMLISSDDGGNTWESTIFMDFPIAGYEFDTFSDADADGEVDTLMGTDGVGAMLIDQFGVTHLSFGEFFFYDNTPDDSLYSVFLVDRLFYWNSSYATDEIYEIGTFQESESDNNTTNDITIDQAPDYRAGLASMPTMGEDSEGKIYVVFSAADEEYLGDQVLRHLFVTTTDDSGVNWSTQLELTPDLDFDGYEYVFPSMVKHFTDILHIVVQRDDEPGLIVRGDLDDSAENEIVYIAVTTDLDITLNTDEIAPAFDYNVFPNPSNGMFGISGNNISGMTLQIFDGTGKLLVNSRLNKSNNIGDKQTFDFSFLPAGAYTLSLSNGANSVTKEIVIRK